jgi:glycosyltransferase involved in cell wall biosynthesis
MSKRILLSCYEVPSWGGASTVLYLLFERMQGEGMDVAYLNLVNREDEAFFRRLFGESFGNPRSLDNVHTCIVEEPLWRAHGGLTDLVSNLRPDLLFGFGFIAARLLELAAPRLPVVFMTSGSRQLKHLVETGAVRDFIGFKESVERGISFPIAADNPERQAVRDCELIVVHSLLVKFAFEHFFPLHTGKIYSNIVSVADFIYPEAAKFQGLKKPSAERDIDVIFVASRWNRPEKNYALARKLVSRCKGLNIHIVGETDRPCSYAHLHGVIARRADLYELLGRSRTLVCPSSLDPAPGVLFEASAMGCNVVASPNCGNWQLCNEELLANQCSLDAFLTAIKRSVSGTYKDNHEQFRGGYRDLVDTLSVFQ